MSGDFAQEIRDHTGESRQDFLNLLTAHNWVFSLFPNRTYVSVRRNLPTYDYYGFIKKHFPGLDMSRRHMSFGQPPDLQRAMSVQLGGSFASERPANLLMHQQSHQLNSSNSHAALWDSQSSSSQNCNNGEQWSPLFLPNTWINNLLSNSQTNVGSLGGLGSLNDTNLSGNNLKTLIALAQNYQTKTSVGVQADELIDRVPINSIGRSGCTCQCTCGRRGATDVGTIRGSTSRASRRSESPPSVDGNNHVERFSPTNNPGFVGDHSLPTQRGDFFPVENSVEKHSVNTNQRYYDPFGTADLLNGSRLNSLRIGN
uniref:Uncharacterized protein n=1 Tax=Caenorhabditis japonica TaxID=281687 RepID=A0A8R1DX19_CAEJA